MKLLQVNIEGHRHINNVLPLIDAEAPDVLCLQEADEVIIKELEARGYSVSFLPYLLRASDTLPKPEGIAIAAKTLSNVSSCYYHEVPEIAVQDHTRYRETTAIGYLLADCIVEDTRYTICTTHFTWTAQGNIASAAQRADMDKLLTALATAPPHLLCGDFNIPRHLNPLYAELLKHYTDTIPTQYTSSLDPALHRLSTDPSRSHLFTEYMVDYIFSQSPYKVTDVSLTFGVSDHAAVIGTVHKAK